MNKYITTSFFVLGGLMVNAQTKKTDTLSSKDKEIEQVELFGERNKKPQGLEVITRLPLKIRDQIQSISVISYKVIEDHGRINSNRCCQKYTGCNTVW